jgi:nanoRNase/pAp phosphatase (c-di-AMP/oligoRNAs hydrolase)
MSLPEVQQAVAVLKRASHVLLLVPEKTSVDAFSSMTALSLALSKDTSKQVHSVSPSHVPQELQFLPGSSQVMMSPQAKPGIIIDIAAIESIAEIRQEQLKGGIRIQLVLPEHTEVAIDAIETHVRQMPYDAIILFGASDLADLGELFTSRADFFYNTPIINIDHRATNEHFGTVNIVDITASSIAEITYELIAAILESEIDADIATTLYAGIVGATQSFQKPSTTPHAFQVAAELMEKKAQTDRVIQELIKTKPLFLLKLAGRTYARLRHDEHGRLFWSLLRELDFAESGATKEHIPLVMTELTNNISGYNAACILYEDTARQYSLYISLGKGLGKRTREIQEQLSAKKENKLLVVPIDAPSLEEAEKRAITKMQGIIPVAQV